MDIRQLTMKAVKFSGLLMVALLLSGCPLQGGSYDPTEDTLLYDPQSNSASGFALTGLSVPDALISAYDGSVTVNAVANGLDIRDRLIDTTFSCYERMATDYSTPVSYTHLTLPTIYSV